MPRRDWTRNELILAFNLYCKTPFGKMHRGNPQVIELAKLINRTPNSVSWKLVNFARLDPDLKRRNIVGASHGSKSDIEVWEEFQDNWEKLSFESEKLLADTKHFPIIQLADLEADFEIREGKEKEQLVRVRVNQNFFRETVLASYGYKCCLTGLDVPELLNASHIVPWAKDKNNRLNPRNGVCLNALHDRAFDRGLVTITEQYCMKVSNKLKAGSGPATTFLLKYDGAKIMEPDKFLPEKRFLKYHNENVYLK